MKIRNRFSSRLGSSYLRKKLWTSALTLFIVYMINFILPRLEPGNVVSIIASSEMLPEQRQKLLDLLGLSKPLYVQFVNYLQQTFGTFPPNYGFSLAHYPLSVWTLITAALPWTLLLVGVSTALSWTGGTLLGAWLAWHRGSRLDSMTFAVSTFMWGVPSYWLATILIYVFSIKLHIFPPALTTSGLVTGMSLAEAQDILSHSFLPILTLVILNLPLFALVMRNTMVTVLQDDFVVAAEARGLRTRTLILGHAARNAMLPSITSLALSFGAILSGAYLTEIIFSYPGLGFLIEQSAIARDYPVLQGILFFSALLVILVNILADVTYAVLDPRVVNT